MVFCRLLLSGRMRFSVQNYTFILISTIHSGINFGIKISEQEKSRHPLLLRTRKGWRLSLSPWGKGFVFKHHLGLAAEQVSDLLQIFPVGVIEGGEVLAVNVEDTDGLVVLDEGDDNLAP